MFIIIDIIVFLEPRANVMNERSKPKENCRLLDTGITAAKPYVRHRVLLRRNYSKYDKKKDALLVGGHASSCASFLCLLACLSQPKSHLFATKYGQ